MRSPAICLEYAAHLLSLLELHSLLSSVRPRYVQITRLKNYSRMFVPSWRSQINAFYLRKNLQFSLEEVKQVTSQCRACAETKPRFYKPPKSSILKATQAFERTSIDFKGPLPSATRNKNF